jgi:acetyltransferase-like isoleucine patch superfamily enzyme
MSFTGRLKHGLRRQLTRRLREYLFFDPSEIVHTSDLKKEGRIVMGRHNIATPQVVTYRGDEKTTLYIGNYNSISNDALFLLGGEHHTEWVTTNALRTWFDLPGSYEDGHPGTRGDIRVGNDTWICRRVTILSGVTIGDGAVIASNSLVNKDVRPFAIVGGNPARELRRRFTDEQIDRLEKIAWWNWPDDRVKEWVDLLCSPDIDAFIEKAESAGFVR